MLSAQLRALPWLWPGLLVVLFIAAASARPVAQALGTRPVAGFAIVSAFGLVIVATLTPGLLAGLGGPRFASFSFDSGSLGQLGGFNATTANALMFAPLAALVAATPRRHGTAVGLIVLTSVLPFMVEGVQWLIPDLGRVGFQLTDAVLNFVGAAIGTLVGVLVRPLLQRHGFHGDCNYSVCDRGDPQSNPTATRPGSP